MLRTAPETTLSRKLEQYRGILEKCPEDLTPVLAFAEAAMRRGLRLEALQAYQKVLGSEPTIAEARLSMAEIYDQQGLISEAYDELVELFGLEPYNPEGHLLARRLAGTGEPPEAAQTYLERGTTVEEVERARTRLSINRSILIREVQELDRIATAQPEPILEYHLAEAQKRLDEVNANLADLENLEEEARIRKLAPPRPPLTPPEVQPVEVEGASDYPFEEQDFTDVPGELGQEDLEASSLHTAFPDEDIPSLEPEALEDIGMPLEPVAVLSATPELDFDLDDLPSLEQPEPLDIPLSGFDPFPIDLTDSPGLELDLDSADALLDLQPEVDPYQFSESVPASDPPVELEAVEFALQPPLSTAELLEMEESDAPIHREIPELDVDSPPLAAQEPAAGPSGEALHFYGQIKGELSALIGQLMKTRGVTSIFICSREGHPVQHSSKDTARPELMGALVVDGLAFLESYAQDPMYWVLECDGGIVVMQMIDAGHALVAVGQAGANFGALRYTMDKIRPKFGELLAAAP